MIHTRHFYPQFKMTERSKFQRHQSKVPGQFVYLVMLLNMRQKIQLLVRRLYQMVSSLLDHYSGLELTVSLTMENGCKFMLEMVKNMNKTLLSIQLIHLLLKTILLSTKVVKSLLKTLQLLFKRMLNQRVKMHQQMMTNERYYEKKG